MQQASSVIFIIPKRVTLFLSEEAKNPPEKIQIFKAKVREAASDVVCATLMRDLPPNSDALWLYQTVNFL